MATWSHSIFPDIWGRETWIASLNHVLYWRRVGQPISLLQGPQSQRYDIVNRMFLCCRDCAGNCRMVRSIQNPYPLTTSSILPPIVTTINVSRHCPVSPGGNIVPGWEPLPWVFISSPLAALVSSDLWILWLSRVTFLLGREHLTSQWEGSS